VQFFYGEEAIQGNLYPQISGMLGADAGKQIQDMISNAAVSGKGTVSTIFSVVILVFTATGVFVEIQDSINSIWHLKAKPTGGFIKIIFNRLISFSMVVSLGFILLVSLVINSVIESLMNKLEQMFSEAMVYVAYGVNLVVTLAIITILFATIFKVLPDAVIRWKQVLPGAIATALLFMLGKFGITIYLSTSNVGSTYGAAGSIIIILLWVYYSAIILYFGALLTRIYLACSGHTIRPNRYAVFVRQLQVENKGTLETQPESEHVRAELKHENDDKEKRIGF
ncbi:MAG TPA: YihY/virulence factor BrkB family protein, partial [Chitinophagaceae bacterium]